MSITGTKFWLQRGFLPHEASAFKDISTEAIKDHRYVKVMIESRMRRFREFYQEHLGDKNTLQSYYKFIRQQYVKNGLTSNQNELLLRGDTQQRNKARTKAFDFFNTYKDKYAIRDTSGKVVETPRKKRRANRKPITQKSSIDQLIQNSKDDIKQSKFRLSYAKSDSEKLEWEKRIKLQEDRIKQLRKQK